MTVKTVSAWIRASSVLLIAAAANLSAQPLANVVFLEPAEGTKVSTQSAEIREAMPVYARVKDPAKYTPWLQNESAARALRLYRTASAVAAGTSASDRPDYYVALVPGGNHGAVGFKLKEPGDAKPFEYPKQPYILLDPRPDAFVTTLLHETGHVALALLTKGRRLEGKDVASIPHSTAALTSRATAFDEGWAIHLEALAAHLHTGPDMRNRFHRQRVQFGDGPFGVSEYFRASSDLASYSQGVARYLEVRENNYAFAPAFDGPDYLRVQLEKARDFATLRDANQLLQSEGFYASFFFLWMIRGTGIPDEALVAMRQLRILEALRDTFDAGDWDESSPWLLRFVESYMKRFADEKAAMAEAIVDLSHGVFIDSNAARLWREHYLATLALDQKNMNVAAIVAARRQWRDKITENPRILWSRLGPEIPCTVAAVEVRLVALGEAGPLRFDVNTAPRGMLRLIPGITEPELKRWLDQRALKPFSGAADFRERAGLGPATLGRLKFESAGAVR